ncbi:MGMT family protein [Candidatus Peregrinibacteria bacterium]|nr:MAG: MGMT family protein [Candidatus Peregrinibacteria bacterium]
MQELLLTIPKGKVTTYKALASAMGTRGYRYIGQLLNQNPEPEKYPCYKVVKADGSLGGFALGCADKITRLKADGIEVKNDRVLNFEQIFYSL